MKISPLLAIAAATATAQKDAERGKGKLDDVNLYDALRIVSGRYEDLNMVSFDQSKYLRKRISKFSRKIFKKITLLDAKGCVIFEQKNDLKKKIAKADVASFHAARDRLDRDMNLILKYFKENNHKKCKKFITGVTNKITAINQYISSKPNLSDIELPTQFAGFSSIRGTVSDNGKSVVFDGIKYATSDRFEHSEPAELPTESDFTEPSHSCPVASNVLTGSETLPRSTSEKEDCLYLKVIAPTSAFDGSSKKKKKVIVWIHGGTFNFGGMDVVYEDPSLLVEEQDIIVVKMNYRLGPFGHWYFGTGDTNFSIGDQRLAMAWVKDNIGAFNGDANNITLAGASAGAHGVMIHLTHEDSWPFFKNAIVMSAAQLAFWPQADAEIGYKTIAVDHLACSTEVDYANDLASGALLECLQNKPLAELQSVLAPSGNVFTGLALASGRLTQMEFTFTPNYDGVTLIEDPRVLIGQGAIKPDMDFLIIEVTSNEAETMSYTMFGNPTMQQLLFQENADFLFNAMNNHLALPQAAWEALVSGLFPSELIPTLLDDLVFGCGYGELGSGDGGSGDGESGDGSGDGNRSFNDGSFHDIQVDFGQTRVEFDSERTTDNPLLNECIDAASTFLSALLFMCPIDLALTTSYSGHQGDMPTNFYAVEYTIGTPGPAPNGDKQWQLPYNHSMETCFEATDKKSCHIEGAHVFFGEAVNQGIEMTEKEVQFGEFYRALYGNIIKGKHGGTVLNQVYDGKWNVLAIDDADFHDEIVRPLPAQCNVLHGMNIYGNL